MMMMAKWGLYCVPKIYLTIDNNDFTFAKFYHIQLQFAGKCFFKSCFNKVFQMKLVITLDLLLSKFDYNIMRNFSYDARENIENDLCKIDQI